MNLSTKDKIRFWSKIKKTKNCWVWTARHAERDGRGVLKVRGARLKAPRIAWTLLVGPIPPGLFVCHQCDNPPCVRPDHLFLGTHRHNMRDASLKGRHHQQKKTACINGHPWRHETTRYHDGGRTCRTCDKLRPRRIQLNRSAKQAPKYNKTHRWISGKSECGTGRGGMNAYNKNKFCRRCFPERFVGES
jgi:HNH endonuclease